MLRRPSKKIRPELSHGQETSRGQEVDLSRPAARIVPHKPKRDDARSHELTDLRRENHQLRRQISRLQKALARLEGLSDAGDPEPAVASPKSSAPTAPVTDRVCQKCGGAVAEFEALGKRYLVCRDKACLGRRLIV